MKIIKDPQAFDLITSFDAYPYFSERFKYSQLLRNSHLYQEANELENYFSEEDFDYYIKLYLKVRKPSIIN